MKKIALLAGARPNFMKIAPIMREIRKRSPSTKQILIHTGQHYDKNLSDVFFKDLGLPRPDYSLGVGSLPHGAQTGTIMIQLEPILQKTKPDLLLVVGDINSTMAGALTAVKMGIPVIHVEAGLRSGDRTMPEEINRMVTDCISSKLLTSCRDGDKNLIREGVNRRKIHFVGNVMIDSLKVALPYADKSQVLQTYGLKKRDYVCVTLHRPCNVDEPRNLLEIIAGLEEAAKKTKVIFPVHPRTLKALQKSKWKPKSRNLLITDPVGYIDFLCLLKNSAVTLTDSGGIQEETTFLGVPCLTVRPNTERPITITEGTNRLIKSDRKSIFTNIRSVLSKPFPRKRIIKYWDGKAAGRIWKIIDSFI